MIPRTDELMNTMAGVLLVIIGAWALSQVGLQAYHGALKLLGAVLGQ